MAQALFTVTVKNHPVRLEGEVPQIGKRIPNSSLTKENLHESLLDSYLGKTLIISTAPSFDTQTCSITAKKLYSALKGKKDVHLLNISCDLPFAQKRFCEEAQMQGADFLSAFRSNFGREWGVQIAEGALKGLLARSLFLIDSKGVLRYIQVVSEVTQEPNYDELISQLQ